MTDAAFEESVFINCPFDEEYAPILQAMLFCIIFLGFTPRLASESSDSRQVRLEKIVGLIEGCLYSIHDLSRCQARRGGEHFRLNMPFELGVDYGCKQFCGNERHQKKLLILEEGRYRYQAAISDLAGCDIESHSGDFAKAMRKVRNWLVDEADAEQIGASRILGSYTDFQEWYYEKQLAAGFSEEDIQDYPTSELLAGMKEWLELGKPV